MLSINPYSEEKCREVLPKYLDGIQDQFGKRVLLHYGKSFAYDLAKYGDLLNIFQEYFNLPNPRSISLIGIFACSAIYYLDVLLANNPNEVLDIGCGNNYFKGIVPNLRGMDPDPIFESDVDEVMGFDEEFIRKNHRSIECAFSTNAIHFISLVDFKQRVEDFASIIKPGGRGMIGMNASRMVERTSQDDLMRLFGTTSPTPSQVESYIHGELDKINLNFLVLETLITEQFEEWIDGNIRMVFEV